MNSYTDLCKKVLLGMSLCFLYCCSETTLSRIPADLEKTIVGDWKVSKNGEKLVLTKFNPDSADSCFVYRFERSNRFLSFDYIKNWRPICGNTMQTNELKSGWRIDNKYGLVIEEYKESVTEYENKTIRYSVFIDSPGVLLLIQNNVLKNESGSILK